MKIKLFTLRLNVSILQHSLFIFGSVTIALLLNACSGNSLSDTSTTGNIEAGVSLSYPAASELDQARNLPAHDKILFVMGQDSETLTEYRVNALEKDKQLPAPGGVTLYTKISLDAKQGSLAGLTKNVDYGSGVINFSSTLAEFPMAALAVGLDITDAHSGCHAIPTRAIGGLIGEGVTQVLVKQYRQQVDQLLVFLKHTDRQVFLRIGYEFDGPWNCYQPGAYVEAFRYIKQRIDDLSANNIATVWQTAAWPRNQGIYQVDDNNHLEKFYPGDEYVDWVSVSTFYGDTFAEHQWACGALNPEWFNYHVTPRSQQDRLLDFARAHNKPVMIAEATPTGYSNSSLTHSCIFSNRQEAITQEEIWRVWYQDWFEYIEANKDVIRAVAYINTFWHSQAMWVCKPEAMAGMKNCNQGYWGDARVQANPYILRKFKEELRKPIYVNGSSR